MDLVVFAVGQDRFALPAREVREVVLRPATTRTGPHPDWLVGFFLLEGQSIAVLRADRLLELPESQGDLYSHLVVLAGSPIALLVDRVLEVCQVDPGSFGPVEGRYNPSVVALLRHQQDTVAILSPTALLSHEERRRLEHQSQRQQETSDV